MLFGSGSSEFSEVAVCFPWIFSLRSLRLAQALNMCAIVSNIDVRRARQFVGPLRVLSPLISLHQHMRIVKVGVDARIISTILQFVVGGNVREAAALPTKNKTGLRHPSGTWHMQHFG